MKYKLLIFVFLFFLTNTIAQTKIGAVGLTNKLSADGEFVFTFAFDLNRTDASKEKNKDLAFWASQAKKTKKGTIHNFKLFPVSDINLGDGVKSSNNNVSFGLLLEHMRFKEESSQSALFVSLLLDYNADKNFMTKISSFSPAIKFYKATKNDWDMVLGFQYNVGTRDTDFLKSSTYLAPEIIFNLSADLGEKLAIKNVFRGLYLQNDNESFIDTKKTYLYNQFSLEYEVFKADKKSQKYSTIGIKYEVGKRAPLFEELNTLSFTLNLYFDI